MAPIVSIGVQVMKNIIPNFKKMTFVNHDLQKFPELAMDKYMVVIKDIENSPMNLVLMEWAR